MLVFLILFRQIICFFNALQVAFIFKMENKSIKDGHVFPQQSNILVRSNTPWSEGKRCPRRRNDKHTIFGGARFLFLSCLKLAQRVASALLFTL
jgi:hypothetical protein